MGQPALSDNELYYTDLPVGEILRRTRSHYGQSVTDIERALRIRASQIEAIESGNLEKLPGRVYAIGFVRSYSEYLGLDGNKMVHLFKTQSGAKAQAPELNFPVPASESKIPPIWLVGASLVGAIVLIAAFWIFTQGDREMVAEIPSVSSTMTSEAEPATVEPPAETAEIAGPPAPDSIETAAGEAQDDAAEVASAGSAVPPETAPAAPPPVDNIILNITQNSWVEIRDENGATIVSRVLKAGDQYYVPDRPDLMMSLGNAGGVSLEVGGTKLEPLGAAGQVRRNIALDAKALKEKFGAKTVEKAPG